MPDDLIDKVIKADNINKGLFNLRQLYFGLFDLKIHTAQDEIDYTNLWNEKREEVHLSLCFTGLTDIPAQIALTSIGDAILPEGQSSFAHLVGGYECVRVTRERPHTDAWRSAGYYGYLYSLSFSADMFATVFEADPLSPEAGMRYRRRYAAQPGSIQNLTCLAQHPATWRIARRDDQLNGIPWPTAV